MGDTSTSVPSSSDEQQEEEEEEEEEEEKDMSLNEVREVTGLERLILWRYLSVLQMSQTWKVWFREKFSSCL